MFALLILLTTGAPVYKAYSYELGNRAPDVLPGTLPEMREPAYWLAQMKNPDEIILTHAQIQHLNEKYRKWVRSADPFKGVSEERKPQLSYWWPGIVMMVPDLQKQSRDAVADTVRKRIRDCIDFMRSKDFGDFHAVKYSERQIDAFEKEMALDLVNDNIILREGITVRTARIRNVPSFYPMEVGIIATRRSLLEQWNIGVLKIARPVTVLHVSRTGRYVFVLCEIGYGWVRSEDIAFGSRKKIDKFINAGDFAVCTGDCVQFYSDKTCTYSSGWFRMGDRLPLVSKGNSREIKVPVRKTNGEFTTETAWLAEDADVNTGWLPYTRRNIVITAFKLLDTPYDFTGSSLGRQHESTYRDIFCCFGFELPYHSGLFTFYGQDSTVLHPDAGKDEQYRVILKHEPFVTIQSCGSHNLLLLGEYNGNPIVFQNHGYSYEDEDGIMQEVRRHCVSDMRMPTYFLKRDITFLVLK